MLDVSLCSNLGGFDPEKTLSSHVNYWYARRHQSLDDVVFKRHWIVLYLAFIALFRIFYPSLYLTVRQLLLTVGNSAVVLDMTGDEKLFLLWPALKMGEKMKHISTGRWIENRKPKWYKFPLENNSLKCMRASVTTMLHTLWLAVREDVYTKQCCLKPYDVTPIKPSIKPYPSFSLKKWARLLMPFLWNSNLYYSQYGLYVTNKIDLWVTNFVIFTVFQGTV